MFLPVFLAWAFALLALAMKVVGMPFMPWNMSP